MKKNNIKINKSEFNLGYQEYFKFLFSYQKGIIVPKKKKTIIKLKIVNKEKIKYD